MFTPILTYVAALTMPLLHQTASPSPDPTRPNACNETLVSWATYSDGSYAKYEHSDFIEAVNQFKACPDDPCKPGDPDPVGEKTASNVRTVETKESLGFKGGLAGLFQILTGTSAEFNKSGGTTVVTSMVVKTPSDLKIGAGTRALYYWNDHYERETESHSKDGDTGQRGRTTHLIMGLRGGTMGINSTYIVCTDDLTNVDCPSKCPPAATPPGSPPTATPCEAEQACTATANWHCSRS